MDAPIKSLKETVKEQAIEIQNDDETKTLLHGICNILQSGVKTIRLQISESSGRIEVDPSCYKSIMCNCVKVKKISDKGYYNTKTEAKIHIETGNWHFPCPDYLYSNIKRNLELAIQEVLGIKEVEVKSFSTGIVEYDR